MYNNINLHSRPAVVHVWAKNHALVEPDVVESGLHDRQRGGIFSRILTAFSFFIIRSVETLPYKCEFDMFTNAASMDKAETRQNPIKII